MIRNSIWPLLLVALVSSPFFTVNLSAATYFVARPDTPVLNENGQESEEGDGTPQSPFTLLTSALYTVQSGDRIIVGDGNYSLEEGNFGPGTFGLMGVDNIKLLAARNASPIVTRFLFDDCSKIVVAGFTLAGRQFDEIAPGWQDMPTIVRACNGVEVDYTADFALRQQAIEEEFEDYFEILNTPIFLTGNLQDELPIGIDLVLCDQMQIRNNVIDGYWAGIQSRGSTKIRIQNNQVNHCVNGIFVTSLHSETEPIISRFLSIIGNRVTQCLDNGIDIRDDSTTVSVINNQVTYSGRNHISLINGVRNTVVRGNTVSDGGFYSETMRFPGSSAISINHCSGGNLISRNSASHQIDLTGIDGNGFIVDFMQGTRSQLSFNRSYRNMGSGINTTESPDTRITGNLLIENGWLSDEPNNGAGIKLSRATDTSQTIDGNLLMLNRTAGILMNDQLLRNNQDPEFSQTRVDRNFYVSESAPLITDGFGGELKTLLDVQTNSPWERRGQAIGPFCW